ncbi:MAG: hypothetical protein NZ534_07700, partial [Bacteroidia bacterium]|nr:hypothetical protein [Bacteroidia bacterium]
MWRPLFAPSAPTWGGRVPYLLLLVCVFPFSIFAQNQNTYWGMGQNIMIITDETDGSVNVSDAQLPLWSEGIFISDTLGHLLFYFQPSYLDYGSYEYFDKSIIRNSQHQIVNQDLKAFWAKTIIIPEPGSSRKFYIFSNLSRPHQLLTNGIVSDTFFLYHKIELTPNNQIIVLERDVIVSYQNYDGKVAAVKHGNGRDWWIVTRIAESNCYHLYILDTIAVKFYKEICQGFPDMAETYNSEYSTLLFSPNGDKLCLCSAYGNCEIFDFDRNSGGMCNLRSFGYSPIVRPIDLNQYYKAIFGVAFSPSGRFIYVATLDSLFQYDTEAENVNASRKLI